MSELPIGWIEVPLLEFIKYLPTGVPTYSGEKDYYSTGSIQDSKYDPEGKFTFDNRPSRANRISKIGDVFQARMKGTDKGLLIEEKLNDKLFSTGFIQLRPYENTYESKLLYYFVKSKIFLDQKDELATGSTQEALTDNKAIELTIIVPPLNEQKRMVVKLDKLLVSVEEAKTRLEKIPVIIKRFRQSVLNAAVTGELTKDWREKNSIISDWEDELLGNISQKIQIGPFGTQLHKSDYIKNGIPLINPTHIQNSRIVPDMNFTIGQIKYRELKNYHLNSGDIIMGRRGEMGRCAIVTKEENNWLCGTGSLYIRPKIEIYPNYLFMILSSQSIKEYLENESKGTTMQNLNLSILKNVPVMLPSFEEQKEIVKRIEALFKKADEIEERYKKAKAFVDKLTQSILAKAFRGELVPQDPNDEPASELLEKIKLEKEKLNLDKKSKKKSAGR